MRSIGSGEALDVEFSLRARQVRLSSYTRVLCRWHDWSEGAPSGDESAVASALYQSVGSLLTQVTAPPVMNRPFLQPALMSKLMQLHLFQSPHWRVPESLLTNRLEPALAFCEAMGGSVIVKGCSGQKTWVTTADMASLRARAPYLPAAPMLIQEVCAGSDVRVHVVGERCFAEETCSSQIDYRRDRSARHGAIEAPTEIQHACVELTRNLGLFLSGIDFKRRQDGSYCFLEINSLPDYHGYDARAGGAITDAVADWLIGTHD